MKSHSLPVTLFISALCFSLSACTPEKPSGVKLDPKQIAAENANTWQEKNKAGLAALSAGRLDDAERELVAALKAAEECGPDDERVAVSLTNLASLYENKKMYGQCAGYLQKARKLFRQKYGDSNQLIPVTERNEAHILTLQNKWAESIPLYEDAVKRMEKLGSKDLAEVKKEYEEAMHHVVPVKSGGAPAGK